uniref:Uncharacterized protein n=1 Tax=Hordeum vulgare subsp. vulgare TaxID=112509 RepID=C1IJB4_HORVV|nr:unknown protein [Hordeum vulgare subsp. vulgare]
MENQSDIMRVHLRMKAHARMFGHVYVCIRAVPNIFFPAFTYFKYGLSNPYRSIHVDHTRQCRTYFLHFCKVFFLSCGSVWSSQTLSTEVKSCFNEAGRYNHFLASLPDQEGEKAKLDELEAPKLPAINRKAHHRIGEDNAINAKQCGVQISRLDSIDHDDNTMIQ